MKNFIIGTVSTGAITLATDVNVTNLPPEVVEMIKVFVSLIGGTISAILMAYLKSKFPNVFNKKKENIWPE